MSKVKAPPPRPRLGPTHDEDVQTVLVSRKLADNLKNRKRAENVVAQHRLAQIAEDIEEKAAEVCLAAMEFGKLRGDETEPTPEMVERYGERAWEMFRLMGAGLMSTKDSPVGLRVAMNIHATAMRTKSDQQTPKLNVQVAQLNVMPTQYPVLKVDK